MRNLKFLSFNRQHLNQSHGVCENVGFLFDVTS